MDEEVSKGNTKGMITSEKGSRRKEKWCNQGAFAKIP